MKQLFWTGLGVPGPVRGSPGPCKIEVLGTPGLVPGTPVPGMGFGISGTSPGIPGTGPGVAGTNPEAPGPRDLSRDPKTSPKKLLNFVRLQYDRCLTLESLSTLYDCNKALPASNKGAPCLTRAATPSLPSRLTAKGRRSRHSLALPRRCTWDVPIYSWAASTS